MAKKYRHFIREWRQFRGLTQEQLAERVGYDRTYISKIEKGTKRYDQPFLEALADALNCQPADLIMRNPTDPESVWSIWERIPAADRPQAALILETFLRRTGTDG